MTDIAGLTGMLLAGFGLGFAVASHYWSGLLKDVLEQNRELLDTWEPKRVVVRMKDWQG